MFFTKRWTIIPFCKFASRLVSVSTDTIKWNELNPINLVFTWRGDWSRDAQTGNLGHFPFDEKSGLNFQKFLVTNGSAISKCPQKRTNLWSEQKCLEISYQKFLFWLISSQTFRNLQLNSSFFENSTIFRFFGNFPMKFTNNLCLFQNFPSFWSNRKCPWSTKDCYVSQPFSFTKLLHSETNFLGQLKPQMLILEEETWVCNLFSHSVYCAVCVEVSPCKCCKTFLVTSSIVRIFPAALQWP